MIPLFAIQLIVPLFLIGWIGVAPPEASQQKGDRP
jgi:hypothetical protein